jgi:hypothetical protein
VHKPFLHSLFWDILDDPGSYCWTTAIPENLTQDTDMQGPDELNRVVKKQLQGYTASAHHSMVFPGAFLSP